MLLAQILKGISFLAFAPHGVDASLASAFLEEGEWVGRVRGWGVDVQKQLVRSDYGIIPLQPLLELVQTCQRWPDGI